MPKPIIAMEARQEAELPTSGGWQYEPKWDGFRCLAISDGSKWELLGRSGKSLSRFFPDVMAGLEALQVDRVILDGELAIRVGKVLSFEELQLRLHPAASRVAKLAATHPGMLIVFDMLRTPTGTDVTSRPLSDRRAALETFFNSLPQTPVLRLSPRTEKRAEAVKWLARAGRGELDGVVAKRLGDHYRAGERAMVKVKNLRSAECVVGGFRYAGTGRELVGSLLLGLYNERGKLDHVGFISGFSEQERVAVTKKVKPLMGGSGFTGDAPGGRSRWSSERSVQWQPLKTKLVVEVEYDHITGNRFRHATRFIRWRRDKPPKQCTFDQLGLDPSRSTHSYLGN
jgi:ATP-dependent DNA ligase